MTGERGYYHKLFDPSGRVVVLCAGLADHAARVGVCMSTLALVIK